MAQSTAKPVIFISYSHKDEPERTPEGDIYWLSDIQSYLAPATKGTFELWTDEEIEGGTDWEKEIKAKLAVCDICILLLSRHSLASPYVIEVELETIFERQRRGHKVQIYPIALSPFPKSAAPPSLLSMNVRPRLDLPLSSFFRHERGLENSRIADEIVGILGKTVAPRTIARAKVPPFVHITGLPETPFENLLGRNAELHLLNEAWADSTTNILSLVAEGGAGKSALINEWLKRLQADNYSGAEMVLGWSFYSQGSKVRATAADEFLNWMLTKLGITLASTLASDKAEAIAEAMMLRRILLVLDGVEPLQHGVGPQLGQLKDLGLRVLLRHFAATSPGHAKGLIVLTTRLAIKDIARWHEDAAPVVDLERLSDEAGMAILRDNGVWGSDKNLKLAAQDFGCHPLALGLLASYLKETQTGDVRRRDHIRAYFADPDNPRHDHAKRVMESYEREWLAGHPVLRAIMYIVGLFDRPARASYFRVLLENPPISGFPVSIVDLNDADWNRAVARLREVRLLAPADLSSMETLDAHPLVREWFDAHFRQTSEGGWRVAHRRIYHQIRDTTKEGRSPTLEGLTPLYQAIVHGCKAGQHKDAFETIYLSRISRRLPAGGLEQYARRRLGATASELAAISWFFEKPFEFPIVTLDDEEQTTVLGLAAHYLGAQGRFAEALPALHEQLKILYRTRSEGALGRSFTNMLVSSEAHLSHTEFLVGDVAAATVSATRSTEFAKSVGNLFRCNSRTAQAIALHAAGQRNASERMFADAEQQRGKPTPPAMWFYHFCDLLLAKRDWLTVLRRATQTETLLRDRNSLEEMGICALILGRTRLGLLLEANAKLDDLAGDGFNLGSSLAEAVDFLHAAGGVEYIAGGLIARARYSRSIGDWDGVLRYLDETEEIAEPGPMKLHLCDTALERARLCLARVEAFAPLNGLVDDSPPKPAALDAGAMTNLKDEAARQLTIVAKYIETCGYHRRDEELVELQGVLAGRCKFIDLPPHV